MGIGVYTKTCAKNVPGIAKVLLTEVHNVSSTGASITVGTDGTISAVTMGTGHKFFEHNCEIDSVELKSEGKGGTVYSINHSIEMAFAKLSTALLAMKSNLTTAITCGVVAIVKDGNGSWWMVGWNNTEKADRPLNAITDNFTSGKKLDDAEGNQFKITLSGMSGYDIMPFDSALTTSLTAESTAASAFCTFN